MALKKITVIGAGTMGNGIAHIFAQTGFMVTLVDVSTAQLGKAIQTITKNLDRQIAKGGLTEIQKQTALANLFTHPELSAGVAEADMVV